MSESVIKFERKSGYTVLQNSMLRDSRLSLKTKGLFALIISLPETWNYNISGLATVAGVGKDAIRSSLDEMEQAGYLTREQSHGERGKFGGNTYVIREESVSPLSGFPTTVEPLTVEPLTVEPLTENPTLLNKDISSKDKVPPKSPKGDGDVLFSRFWNAYPNHVAKDKARRAWKKLKPSLALCRTMAAALTAQKASDAWTKDGGQFIPHAATWLNGKRWEDELEPSAPPLNDTGAGGEKWGWGA